jgi:DNA-damage-inducible protein J
MKSDALTIRVEHDTLVQVTQLLSDLGMTASTAVNMLFKQMLHEDGLPFKPSRARSNAETRAFLDRIESGEEELHAFETWDEAKTWLNA